MKKDNTLMYVAAGAALLLLLSNNKKSEVSGIGASNKLRLIYWQLPASLRDKADAGEDYFALTGDDYYALESAMDQYDYAGRNTTGKSPARHTWDMIRRYAHTF